MRIAVIEPDMGQIEIYREALEQYNVNYFESPYTFLKVDHGMYDVLIVAHRFGEDSWEKVYDKLKNKPLVIVTASFPKEYYKKEFPNDLYPLLSKIDEMSNVIFHEKNNWKKIKRSLVIELLANS